MFKMTKEIKIFPSFKRLKCLVNLESGREINVQFYEDKNLYVTRKLRNNVHDTNESELLRSLFFINLYISSI